jgi:hypothetical protein
VRFVLALALALRLAVPAFAAGEPAEQTVTAIEPQGEQRVEPVTPPGEQQVTALDPQGEQQVTGEKGVVRRGSPLTPTAQGASGSCPARCSSIHPTSPSSATAIAAASASPVASGRTPS